MRVVVGTAHESIETILREHLDNHGFGGVEIHMADSSFVVDEEVEAGRLCTLALHNEIFASPRVHLISRLGRQLSVGSSRLLTMLLLDMSAFKSR